MLLRSIRTFAAGVRFVRIARKATYDVVVGNPPYQGLSKVDSFGYVTRTYPRGRGDLYAAFLERGLELARQGGFSALVTMRGWMFLNQFSGLRRSLLHNFDLRSLGDLDKGAFETMTTSQLISVSMAVFHVSNRSIDEAVALQPTAPGEKYWGPDRTDLKRAAILAQRGLYHFDPRGFEVIEDEPIVYWWTQEFLKWYEAVFPARVRTKCHDDPSLAVAHGCFWALHPAKAYAWELRLQDEIRPDFTIDEADSDAARQTFLAEHAREADEIRTAEMRRRERKAAKADDEGGAGPLFDADAEESADE